MVGTSVRESRYEAIIANTTAMASGVNRYRAVPVSRNTGTNTMQIDMRRDESRDGDLRRAIEHRVDQRLAHGDIAVRVLDLHGGVVHQDADGESQAAQRHHVDRLSQQAQNRQARRGSTSGIEMQTIKVLRQLPRNSRIIRPVRPAAISASRTTPSIDARTNTD